MNSIYSDIVKAIDTKNLKTIAIEGNAASGKTTLAALLAAHYDCNVFHMDDFFLPPERKTPERLSEPGGNVDYERFRREVTDKLGTAFTYRRYDCKTGTYSDVDVLPKEKTIVEGAYALHPLLRHVFDLKVFLRISPDIQRQRILKRNGEVMLERFLNEWIPLENRYFESLEIRKLCDIINSPL